jgi:hypothetical protein
MLLTTPPSFENYSGTWTISPGQRLYEFISNIAVHADTIILAGEAIIVGKNKGTDSSRISILCKQFGMHLLLPNNGALKWAMAAKRSAPDFVIGFEPLAAANSKPFNGREWQSDGVLGALTVPFIAAFVLLYERHSDWIRTKWPQGPATYPDIIRFSWMIRNTLAHRGICNLRASGPTCNWHHLNFSPADAGKDIYPKVIGPAEIIILAIEMGFELDNLRCPNP